ncbi:hypothetical protein [Azohydromonas australica]|uniref:hypothetical protein n=1 Tax=Azohydromonas australica TaxID=364039 RepID=UPI0012EB6FFF|nr:hypothetical protein [Azohydromonas australica]
MNQRELVSEIHIATREDPQIDLWILATSRDVDSNITRWLEEEACERGIDYLILACGGAADPKGLDMLCAHDSALVLQHCASVLINGTSELEDYLAAVRGSISFSTRLERIRSTLNGGTVGLPSFRDRMNEKLVQALRSEMRSRGRFGRRLDVAGAGDIRDIPRLPVQNQLDGFLNGPWDAESSTLCVVHGEEGNGKSWALASWIYKRMDQPNAPAVFWFSAGDCSAAYPIRQLAHHAIDNLAEGREINFHAKLQRWIKGATRKQLLVILDGINERHSVVFWTEYLVRSISEFDGRVSIIVTCRTQTWVGNLAERLPLQPQLIEVAPFDDNEFAAALVGLEREDVDRLRRVGPLVRKPRYLAMAIQVIHELQVGEDLTVERLFYEVMRRQARTRTTYPLSGRELEEVLRHLARQESNRLSTRDAAAGLPVVDPSGEIFRELASGGVLRPSPTSGYVVDQRYFVEGIALLLVDILNSSTGTIEEHRERIAQWLSDTHRFPLTARICASASFRALVNTEISTQAAAAIILEFIKCQNPDLNSLEGVLLEAAKRVNVLCDVCEQLWSERGVDHAVERVILKGLVGAASDPNRQDTLKERLTRWAGLIHSSGERDSEASNLSTATPRERAAQVAPSVGQAVNLGGGVSLTRVESQRLVRLGRVALAVVSFSNRRFFYPVLVTSLAADAVMLSSRSDVVYWILASSRQPLVDLVQMSIGAFSGLSPSEASRVERTLVHAIAAPELATHLRALDAQMPHPRIDIKVARTFRIPTYQQLSSYLIDLEVPNQWRLGRAKDAASNPAVSYPSSFIKELCAAVHSFNGRTRRQSFHTADADYNWELYEPVLCRVDRDLLSAKLFEFVNDISQRTGERLYAWVFAADGLTPLLGSSEIAAVRQAWDTLNTRSTDLSEQERFAEAMLLCMLLAHAMPVDQVDMLIARRNDIHLLARTSSYFKSFGSIEEQAAVAARIGSSSKALTAILWFASEQATLDDAVWSEPVRQGLASTSTIDRGLALQIASKLSREIQNRLVADVNVRSPDACALERLYGTRLLLEHADGPVLGVLARCDLRECCHLAGRPRTRCRDEVLQAFAGLVLDWLRRHICSATEVTSALPIVVRAPSTREHPRATVSVDWSKQDNSGPFRSEMTIWGGLPPGEPEAFARAFGSDDDHSQELQTALEATLDAAQQGGNWGFASFWSDDTLTGLVKAEPSFLPEVEALLKEAVARQTLHAVMPFATALCRSLLPSRSASALRLLTAIGNERNFVTDVDGWSGEKLTDLALFSAPDSEKMRVKWLQRMDDAKNDAELLLCAEQLLVGGNSAWLNSVALHELTADASYHRRRAILLLAASAADDQQFEAVVASSLAEKCGLEEVVTCARRYRDTVRWMAHWIEEGMKAEDALGAYCSVRLLLLCADHRVWRLLSDAGREAATSGVKPVFLQMLSHDDIKNAVKKNTSNSRKTLFGLKICEHDSAPWIDL